MKLEVSRPRETGADPYLTVGVDAVRSFRAGTQIRPTSGLCDTAREGKYDEQSDALYSNPQSSVASYRVVG